MNWKADEAGCFFLQDQNGILQIADDVSNILHPAIDIIEVCTLTTLSYDPLDYNRTIILSFIFMLCYRKYPIAMYHSCSWCSLAC